MVFQKNTRIQREQGIMYTSKNIPRLQTVCNNFLGPHELI